MKKLTIIAALAVALPGIAQAETYVELRGGGAWLSDTSAFDPGTLGTSIINAEVSLDTGWVGALAVGIDPDSPFRFELEYSHRENDIDTLSGTTVTIPPTPFAATVPGNIATDAVLAIAYGDMALESAPSLTPYFGVGAGVAFTNMEIDGINDSETMLAVTLRAGVAFSVSPSIDLTTGASLFLADQDWPFGSDIDQIGHTVTAGLRYSF